MCGIVGYVGQRNIYKVLIEGLKRLEYRGYDSAGVAMLDKEGNLFLYKRKGKVDDLDKFVKSQINVDELKAVSGIGHTRWATHGEPNDINAHPHTSMSNKFIVIHNGIIENFSDLKRKLIARGYEFKSETDTEVLAHLFEEIHRVAPDLPPEEVVRLGLTKVSGAFGIAVLFRDEPEKIIAARRSSPLVIGIGENEYLLASDATPIIPYTKNVIYLNDNDIAIIKPDELTIKQIKTNTVVKPEIKTLEIELEAIEKGGYDHFMLKEIYEQPRSIKDSMRGRIKSDFSGVYLGGLQKVEDKIKNADRFIIVGCGTSWHAGLVGEYIIEKFARVPVEVEYGSEFRYRDTIIRENDIVIAISQSGETADTLAAVKIAKEKGALVLGICNVVGSSIARETHAGIYTHAGPEIGVASTKAFTAQLIALYLFALRLAETKQTLTPEEIKKYTHELSLIPDKIEELLYKIEDKVKEIAEVYKDASNFLYLGRGFNFPIALEGALKLKEISYIHAEGYPAAEMKHGPIALIDENMPCVIIATKDNSYEKIVSNAQEVKARKGKIIAVVTEGDTELKEMADHVIEIPYTLEPFVPLLSVIPLQLLSYHIAVMRGCNVDQPRNLAKSVTVE